MRPVVNSHAHKSQHKKNHYRTDQARTKFAHVRTSALAGDSQHCADQSEQTSAGTQQIVSEERTNQKSKSSGHDIQKKIARGAVQFFESGAQLHQRHHVETDVNQSTMQKHRGDEAIPLMLNVNSVWRAHAEAVGGFAAHSPQNAETPAFALGRGGHPLDSEHHQVGN